MNFVAHFMRFPAV